MLSRLRKTEIGQARDGRPIWLIAGASETSTESVSTTTADESGDGKPDETAGLKSALDKEREARKAAEKDAKRARELEAELAKFRESQQTDAEKAVNAAKTEADKTARAEVTAAFLQRIAKSEIRAAAGGKLADPEDAVSWFASQERLGEFVDDEGDPKSDLITKALDDLLKDKPHWAAGKQSPSFNGGPRLGADLSSADPRARDLAQIEADIKAGARRSR